MATTTTRSPSPNHFRPSHITSNSRNTDMDRKSVIISNNSVELQHRNNSGSKGCSATTSRRASLDHKENGPSVRARSPSCAVKGTKNFMAPTISAASKIIVSSPKRKILSDKNEIVRSSISSIDSAETEQVLVKTVMDFPHQVSKDYYSNDGIRSKLETACGFEDISYDYEPRMSDIEGIENQKEGENLSQPAIAPLDADPSSLPPYDPSTNYLSPRPRFLHYRPNPRIEQYLHYEAEFVGIGDAKRLEDSFSTESCEETLEHAEEEQCFEKQKEWEEVCSSSEVEVVQNVDENVVIESEPVMKSNKKESGLSRSIFVRVFIMLVVSSVSAFLWTSPFVSPTLTLKGSQFVDDFHLKDHLAPVYVKELASRLKHWSSSTLASYANSDTTSNEEFGPLFMVNFSVSVISDHGEKIEYCSAKSILEYEQANEVTETEKLFEEHFEELQRADNFVESELSVEELKIEPNKMEVIEDYLDVEEQNEENAEYSLEESQCKDDETLQYENEIVYEQDSVEAMVQDEIINESGAENHADNNPEPIRDTVTENEKIIEDQEDINSAHSAKEAHFSDDNNRLSQPAKDHHDSTAVDLDSQAFESNGFNQKRSSLVILGITILLLLPAAYFVFRSMKKSHSPETNTVAEEPAEPTEKATISMSISGSSESYGVRRGSRYDMTSFGPSEFVSGLQQSSSVGQKRTTRNEIEEESFSQERRPRRDSTASSVSYGSFTTYEKRSAKKGSREDDVLTPVRRSSRIQNKVTSS